MVLEMGAGDVFRIARETPCFVERLPCPDADVHGDPTEAPVISIAKYYTMIDNRRVAGPRARGQDIFRRCPAI